MTRLTATWALTVCLGENHLSFIETSALDASNVELAFQNILTGTQYLPLDCASFPRLTGNDSTEIYRIVSSKALESGDGAQANIASGTGITLTNPVQDDKSKSGCC